MNVTLGASAQSCLHDVEIIVFTEEDYFGFGRELSRYSMLEFVNIKSIRFYDELVHHHYVE